MEQLGLRPPSSPRTPLEKAQEESGRPPVPGTSALSVRTNPFGPRQCPRHLGPDLGEHHTVTGWTEKHSVGARGTMPGVPGVPPWTGRVA